MTLYARCRACYQIRAIRVDDLCRRCRREGYGPSLSRHPVTHCRYAHCQEPAHRVTGAHGPMCDYHKRLWLEERKP